MNQPANYWQNALERYSSLYRLFLREREEILKLKWLESEKAGFDIGFERALIAWVMRHRAKWLKAQRTAARCDRRIEESHSSPPLAFS